MAELPVNQFLGKTLIADATGERRAGDPVRCLVKPLNGVTQSLGLNRIGMSWTCTVNFMRSL